MCGVAASMAKYVHVGGTSRAEMGSNGCVLSRTIAMSLAKNKTPADQLTSKELCEPVIEKQETY